MYVDSLVHRSILDLATFHMYFVGDAIKPAGLGDRLLQRMYNAEVYTSIMYHSYNVCYCGRCLLWLELYERPSLSF